MALSYSSTDAPLADYGVKILVYAGFGLGKTSLIPTLPGEVVAIGAERGELSIARKNQIRMFGKYKHIPIIRIESGEDLEAAYNQVAGPHGAGLNSIALDSVSEIAEKVLAVELKRNKDPRKAYGNMQEVMSKYVRLFRDLPNKHVYFTCAMQPMQDADGLIRFGPDMPGKTLTNSIGYFFDEVFHLSITKKDPTTGKDIRLLRTRADHQFSAKDRSGALDELEPADLSLIINKIQNN